MRWLLDNIQIVVALVAALAYYLTRAKRRDEDETEAGERTFTSPPEEDREQLERTRRIQEEIRRKIAERRGTTDAATRPIQAEAEPPVIALPRVPPVDPFGGSMRRILREIGEAAQARIEPVVDSGAEARAQIERQNQLAEQLRALEASRMAERRRITEREAVPPGRRPAIEGAEIRSTLRNPRELRRAVLLREILGPPVALR